MIVLVVVICLILFIVSIQIYEKWINPITVYIVPHNVSLILLLGSNFLNNNLSFQTYLAFFMAEIIYSLGVIVSEKLNIKKHKKSIKKRKINIYVFLLISSIVIDFFIIIYIRDISSRFGILNAYLNLSSYNAFLQNEGVNSLYNSLVFFSIPLSLLIQFCLRKLPDIKNRKIIRTLLVLQYIMCFIPFISARRAVLMSSIIMNIILFYLMSSKKRKHNYKRVITIIVIVYLGLLFFSKTQEMMNKSVDIPISCFGISIPTVLRDAFGYVAGNYSYLDQLFEKGIVRNNPPLLATFRIAYIYLVPLFGWKVDTVSAFALNFLQIGKSISYGFNTLPIHYYFIIDLGSAYLVEFFIFGYITGLAYKKVMRTPKGWSYMFCAFQFSLVLLSFREYDMIVIYSIMTLFFFWMFSQFRYTINKEVIEEL